MCRNSKLSIHRDIVRNGLLYSHKNECTTATATWRVVIISIMLNERSQSLKNPQVV